MVQNRKRFIVWSILGLLMVLITFITLIQTFADEVQWNEAIACIVILLFMGGVYELWQHLLYPHFYFSVQPVI